MKDSEVLRRAAVRLSKQGAWTKGAFARSESGVGVAAKAEMATCWCAIGAIRLEAPIATFTAEKWLWRVIPKSYSTIYQWNDRPRQTQEGVVSALEAAANTAEFEGR